MECLNYKLFFSLLRVSLWHRTEDQQQLEALLAQEKEGWPSVLASLDEHALIGVVADAILSLPAELQPDAKQQGRLMQQMASMSLYRYQTQQAIVEVVTRLEEADCHPILLKGEGLTQLYPERCLRASGDVDVYVGEKDFEQAVACINALCTPEAVEHGKYGNHDYSIQYRGIPFEIHFKPGYAAVERCEEQFQQLARTWLVPERCDHITLLGKEILTPAQQYNILYVFEHLARHYRNSELGIRQFLDWSLALDRLTFDEMTLRHDLERLDELKAWQRLAGILQQYLGVKAVPFLDTAPTPRRTDRILNAVMRRGNFAQRLDEMDQRGGFFHLASLYQQSRDVALIYPNYAHRWFLRQLKTSILGVLSNPLNKLRHRNNTSSDLLL